MISMRIAFTWQTPLNELRSSRSGFCGSDPDISNLLNQERMNSRLLCFPSPSHTTSIDIKIKRIRNQARGYTTINLGYSRFYHNLLGYGPLAPCEPCREAKEDSQPQR